MDERKMMDWATQAKRLLLLLERRKHNHRTIRLPWLN
jgi:hypothetical protein